MNKKLGWVIYQTLKHYHLYDQPDDSSLNVNLEELRNDVYDEFDLGVQE